MTTTPEDGEELPSKSARKRTAQAAQELGEELIALPEAELDALALPEHLRDAIDEARRLKSRAAGVRQRQYIGKLMREIDPEPIRAALAARSQRAALEAQRFHRLETWRERLIGNGPEEIEALAAAYPHLDRRLIERLTAAAREEQRRTGAVGPAGRELFRALRRLSEAAPA